MPALPNLNLPLGPSLPIRRHSPSIAVTSGVTEWFFRVTSEIAKSAKCLTLSDYFGGARRNRTDDLFNAIEALSQLSYGPTNCLKPIHFQSFIRTPTYRPAEALRRAI